MRMHRLRDRAEDHAGLGELFLEVVTTETLVEHRVDGDLGSPSRVAVFV